LKSTSGRVRSGSSATGGWRVDFVGDREGTIAAAGLSEKDLE
jgi:hypothetical protein